jgi:hypothetical protein
VSRSFLIFIIFSSLIGVVLGQEPSSVNVRNEYLVTKPGLGGKGYDKIYPQVISVNQDEQVNITVRNLDAAPFTLTVDSITTATIKPAIRMSNGTVLPVDTLVPIVKVSKAGIFSFNASGHREMDGNLVVLPSDWTSYNPPAQERRFNIVVLPDFCGDGYDKFFPETIVVNQDDNVSIGIRSLDDHPHGLAIPAYNIDTAISPIQQSSNGTTIPSTTNVPTFTASTPGIFRFACTVYCGASHFEMVGSLVVLPKGNTQYNPQPTVSYSYITVKPDF